MRELTSDSARHLTPDEVERFAVQNVGGRIAARQEVERHKRNERHLKSCSCCAGEIEALREVIAGLERLATHRPPPGFADRVARRLRLVRGLEAMLKRLPAWSPSPGFASAVLARVRLPVPWPDRILRLARQRRTALVTACTGSICTSAAFVAWLLRATGAAPPELPALVAGQVRAFMADVALEIGAVGYQLGLMDNGGSAVGQISPVAAVGSLGLIMLLGLASVCVMTRLFKMPVRQRMELSGGSWPFGATALGRRNMR